jgi:hypothetical protein
MVIRRSLHPLRRTTMVAAMTEPILNLAELRERAEAIDRAQTGDEAYALGSIQADDVLILIEIAEAAHAAEEEIAHAHYHNECGECPPTVTTYNRLRSALARVNFDNP